MENVKAAEAAEADGMAYLGEKPIGWLMWSFVAPAVVGMLTHGMYFLADRIFVGHCVGPLGLSALAVVFPVMMAGIGGALLFGGGGSSQLSLRMGEGKKKEAERYLSGAIGMGFLCGLIITVVGLLSDEWLLRLFGADEELIKPACDYLYWLMVAQPLFICGFVFNFMIRAEGNPKLAVVIMVSSTLVNIVLDWLFIMVFKWGVNGAALATAFAEVLTFAMGVLYYASGKSELRIRVKQLIPAFRVLAGIVILGMPACLVEVLFGVQQTFMIKELLRHGGGDGFGGNGRDFCN